MPSVCRGGRPAALPELSCGKRPGRLIQRGGPGRDPRAAHRLHHAAFLIGGDKQRQPACGEGAALQVGDRGRKAQTALRAPAQEDAPTPVCATRSLPLLRSVTPTPTLKTCAASWAAGRDRRTSSRARADRYRRRVAPARAWGPAWPRAQQRVVGVARGYRHPRHGGGVRRGRRGGGWSNTRTWPW